MGVFVNLTTFVEKNIKMSKLGAFDMGPAKAPSPLIKTARWGFLVAGVFWGYKRFYENLAEAEAVREYEAHMKATWDREAEIREIKRARNELMYLAPMFSVTPKDDFVKNSQFQPLFHLPRTKYGHF